MDEIACAKYIQRSKKADELYRIIRELYGSEIPWKTAYYKALRDKIVSADEKNLLKEFYPLDFNWR